MQVYYIITGLTQHSQAAADTFQGIYLCVITPSFLSSCLEVHSAVSEEKSKMPQPIRGQGGHLLFPIGPKNTNLIEDVKILLPVRFR